MDAFKVAGALVVANIARGMIVAGRALAVVVFGTGGFGIIAAAWFIPITILIHKAAKGPCKHTALGVCTLLFCNDISGILMLVDDSQRPVSPLS